MIFPFIYSIPLPETFSDFPPSSRSNFLWLERAGPRISCAHSVHDPNSTKALGPHKLRPTSQRRFQANPGESALHVTLLCRSELPAALPTALDPKTK